MNKEKLNIKQPNSQAEPFKNIKTGSVKGQSNDLDKVQNSNLSCDREGIQTFDPQNSEGATTEASPKVGYKKTKLGWIPAEWEVKELKEIGNVISGLTYSPDDVRPNGVLVLRSSNIQDSKLSFHDNVYVDPKKLNFNSLKNNDILICVRNGSRSLIGKSTLIPNDLVGEAFGAFMTVFRSESNIYLNQLFNSDFFYREVHKNIGATINSINGGNLKKFKFPIPPPSEQKKIAAILTTWDSAIALQQDLITAKQKFKKALTQQLLTGKKRFPGFEGEWEEVKLNDLGTIYTGGTPSSSIKKYWNGEITWYTPSEIRKAGKYISVSERKITALGLRKSSAKLFPKHTIVVCTRATIGEVSISTIEASTNQGFKNICVNKDNNVEFVYYLLKTSKQEFLRKSSGSTFLELSTTDFRNMKFKVPTIYEQQKIATTLSAADQELTLLQNQLIQLQDQKRGLMQRLLTGEVRVKI
ncbi:restriction endonuclease subunit S [Rasiella sp. SM2506]|uniref:restriction endonuclease subunit S n=1 Tax=Rasiella sp. SM2506 TaxID=3423914 RepID=UPI003D78B573